MIEYSVHFFDAEDEEIGGEVFSADDDAGAELETLETGDELCATYARITNKASGHTWALQMENPW